MNYLVKQFLIIGTTFFLILWFQNCEDAKNKKVRTTIHEKYKLPILVAAILGLILNFNDIFMNNSSSQVEDMFHPISSATQLEMLSGTKPSVPTFDIYTDIPDF